MIDLIINFFAFVGPSVPVEVTQMQALIDEWVAAITDYVLEFVNLIMPLFIYVIVFQIVLRKS
jgi:hypothetical protein